MNKDEHQEPHLKKQKSSEASTPDGEAKTPEGQTETDSFSKLDPRWQKWWIRTFFTLAMISGFVTVLYMGPPAILCLILAIQVKCYHEIISIGHIQYRKYNLPWFRTLSWYFLGCSNYFFYGEFVADFFQGYFNAYEITRVVYHHRRLIAFLLYTIGIMMFVLSLKKNYYKVQFALFGWYQITLLILLTPSHMMLQNLFSGLIWFLMPASMVICNDIWAYIFGFFFGRTRLIKLSPKKTWEGFIGGYFATVVFGIVACEFMSHFQYFYCPIQYNGVNVSFATECEMPPSFVKSPLFTVPPAMLHLASVIPSTVQTSLSSAMAFVGVSVVKGKIWMYPMLIHSLALASFSSLIAPFGGFFASGFKRAFKIKDFANTIPGHGGIMDRFDCQVLMGIFVNVYIASFIRAIDANKILQQLYNLKNDEQIFVYKELQHNLASRGLL